MSKTGTISIHFRRDILEDATVKQEPAGEWGATFGIDVGILKYAHDTDGHVIESTDFSEERERLERAQRDLSRKEHGSEIGRSQPNATPT